MEGESIVCLCGTHQKSTCGYCKSTKTEANAVSSSEAETSITFGLWAIQLTCSDYQDLIDRGWRRSGCYLYKPDLLHSCCPQFAIRLDSRTFELSKSQFKHIKQLKNLLGKKYGFSSETPISREMRIDQLMNVFTNDRTGAFRLVLQPSKFELETFELYKKYQETVHKDPPEKITPDSYKRFLVDSPLIPQNIGAGWKFGSFHQKYYFRDKLIACAVIDILPKCVSSVYFMYDPDCREMNLGLLSALNEISTAQKLSVISADLHYYYLGFYIHDCPKMYYKAQYRPSYLLCPFTYTWHPYSQCKELLDKQKVPRFGSGPLALADPEQVPSEDLGKIHLLLKKANKRYQKLAAKDVPELQQMLSKELSLFLLHVGDLHLKLNVLIT